MVEVGKNDQYVVRITGTGRMTLRNRRFLRKFKERSLHVHSATNPTNAAGPTDSTSSPNRIVKTSTGNELVHVTNAQPSGSDKVLQVWISVAATI